MFKPFPGLTEDQNRFMAQLKVQYPQLYNAGLRSYKKAVADMGVNGLGVDWGGIFTSVASGVKDLLPVAVKSKQQQDAMKLQLHQLREQTKQIEAQTSAEKALAQQMARQTDLNQQKLSHQGLASKSVRNMGYIALGLAAVMAGYWVYTNR